MAVVKITDNKANLPPVIKVTIGRASNIIKVNTTSVIYNKPVI